MPAARRESDIHAGLQRNTGHAEVIQVNRPSVAIQDLLEVFWKTHDPTTRDRQEKLCLSTDPWFYHSDDQKKRAEEYKKETGRCRNLEPIVPGDQPDHEFLQGRTYQDYTESQPGYCAFVIRPKVSWKKCFETG
jgi:peptide-methionine (S)-S-oxide reductase